MTLTVVFAAKFAVAPEPMGYDFSTAKQTPHDSPEVLTFEIIQEKLRKELRYRYPYILLN